MNSAHRQLQFIFGLGLTVVFLAIAAGPVQALPPEPIPIDEVDSLQSADDTLDPNVVIFTQDYAEFINELEDALVEFDDFLQEYGITVLSETEKSLRDIQKTLVKDYLNENTEDVIDQLDEAIDEIEKVSDDIKENEGRSSFNKRTHLKKLQREIEDIRDQLEYLADESEKDNYDGETMSRIIMQGIQASQEAIARAEAQIRAAQRSKGTRQTPPVIYIPSPPAAPATPSTPVRIPKSMKNYEKAMDAYKSFAKMNDAQNFNAVETKHGSVIVSAAKTVVQISNNIGSVYVRTWNKSEVYAELTIRYIAESEKSKELAEDITLQMQTKVSDNGAEGDIAIAVDYPDDNRKMVSIIGTELDVKVPANNQVHVQNSFGPLEVYDLRNSLTAKSSFAEVSIVNIKGDVKITNSSGPLYLEKIDGRIDAENSFGPIEGASLTGDIILTNSYAPIEIKRSTGRLKISNSGNITVNRHIGDAQIQSGNGSMELYDISGILAATNSFGEITAENIGGDATVENLNGPVNLTDINGRLKATNKFGAIVIENAEKSVSIISTNGSIDVERVQGDVSVENRFGPVNLGTIGGSVKVENSNSPVEISDVKKDVRVTNQFSPITLYSISGDVDAENINSSVELVDIGGISTVSSSNGLITCENIRGAFTIMNNYGNVELYRLTDIDKDSKISTSHGDIVIELPQSAKFNLSLSTSHGEVGTDFPMDITKSGATTFGEIKAGSGEPNLTVHGENSSIRLIAR